MSDLAMQSWAGPQFKLSEEQEMLSRMTRDFVADNIIPVAAEYDEKAIFPEDLFHKARQLGIVNMLVPEAYGGVGASCFEEALVSEELGYGCTGIGTSLGVNSLAILPILIAGSDEQKAYWLGERVGELGQFCSYGVTEADAGSNVAGIQTRADKQGAAYIINGSKTFITNASYAHFYTIFAKTDIAAGHRGMTCFIVDRESPGLSVGKKFDKLGQRASDTAEIVFDNVEVPEENIVGEVGQGFYIAMKVFDHSRPGVAAAACGLQRRALEECVKYAGERQAFGLPIYQHQAVGHKIADMAINYEASRLLTWQAAWQVDAGVLNPRVPAYAKAFAADMATKAAVDAVQVFGGYGYMKEYPVEKLLRDVKIFQIYEGTSEIQRNIIVRELFRGR
ncbi:MAG: acyl-CoA dehydrogenase family protein [Chloroflexota bacterium]|nr:acyl-CoA dehydrogenase family protein [Chloroflexota bacterium]MDE2909379.1 acyl-CoA dehydrogenase family protein [Chloroflexota bacterium]